MKLVIKVFFVSLIFILTSCSGLDTELAENIEESVEENAEEKEELFELNILEEIPAASLEKSDNIAVLELPELMLPEEKTGVFDQIAEEIVIPDTEIPEGIVIDFASLPEMSAPEEKHGFIDYDISDFLIPKGILGEVTVTNLYDYFASADDLEYGDGFSCVVRTPDMTILVDTPYQAKQGGEDKTALIRNMAKMNVSPEEIDAVFLTHSHGIPGLEAFLKENPDVVIYGTSDMYFNFDIDDYGAKFLEISDFSWLSDYVYSTGAMEGTAYGAAVLEQLLIVKGEDGLVVICGCAHPGIDNILNELNRQFPDEPIALFYGGLHLKFENDVENLEAALQTMEEAGVLMLSPSHCSGKKFREVAEGYDGIVYFGEGAGSIIEIQ